DLNKPFPSVCQAGRMVERQWNICAARDCRLPEGETGGYFKASALVARSGTGGPRPWSSVVRGDDRYGEHPEEDEGSDGSGAVGDPGRVERAGSGARAGTCHSGPAGGYAPRRGPPSRRG